MHKPASLSGQWQPGESLFARPGSTTAAGAEKAPWPEDDCAVDAGSIPRNWWRPAWLAGTAGWWTSTAVHLAAIAGLALITLPWGQPGVVVYEWPADQTPELQSLPALTLDGQPREPATNWAGSGSSPDLATALSGLALPGVVDLPPSLVPPEDNLLQELAPGRADLANHEVNPGGRGSTFFGIEIQGNDVVYVVDRSGSMTGPRWEAARSELIKSVRSLSADQNFFVFLFSDSCHPMPQLAGRNRLVPATPANMDEVQKWLMRQVPDSNTRPRGSVMRGLRMDPDTVFLLTDGIFQDETGPFLLRRAVLQESVSEADDLVIHTIAFHSQAAIPMLQAIAEAYRGTFRSVD